MRKNEQAWIQKIQKWDKNIFSEIYQAYLDEIYAFVARKIDGTADVEDIVSTVFHKAFLNLEKSCTKKNPNIRAWLYTIARNCVIDFYRTKTQKQLDDNYDIIDNKTSPLEDIQKTIIIEEVMHYLSRLWDDIHDLFIMRYRQGLSYAEITKINGKTEANNKKIFSRTCQKLRTQFSWLSAQ